MKKPCRPREPIPCTTVEERLVELRERRAMIIQTIRSLKRIERLRRL